MGRQLPVALSSWQLPSALSRWSLSSIIFSSWDSVIGYMRKGRKRSDSELEICIARRIAQKKLQWTRWMVSIILPLLSAVMLMCVLFHRPAGQRVLAAGRMYALTAIHFLMLLTKVFPDWLSSRNVNLWHSMVMCCLVLGASPLSVEKRSDNISLYALLLLSCSFANLKLSLCVFWSLIHTLVKSYTFVYYVYDPQSSCEHMQLKPLDYFREQAVVCGITVALTGCFMRLLESDVRHHVEADTERTQSSALSSLLGVMCEVVVELDADLAFADEVPGFESLLLYRDRGKSPRGVKLETFMPDDIDRQNFRSHIEQKRCNSAASLLHTTLHDSLRNCIRTDIFHVPFRSCSGQVHHLIGIRENSDDFVPQDPFCSSDADDHFIPKISTASRYCRRDARLGPEEFRDTLVAGVPSQDRRGDGSRSSGIGSESSSDVDLGALSNAQVDFILGDSYYPVMVMSSEFAKAFGSSSIGTSLQEWIPESSDFYKRLQKRKVAIFAGGRAPVIETFSKCCIWSRRRRRHSTRPPSTKCISVQVFFPNPRVGRDPKDYASVGGEGYRVSLRVLPPLRKHGHTKSRSESGALRESGAKVALRASSTC